MHRWEKRLADLAHILGVCRSMYFEPEIFRININHFLTTARTVTFLIQKEKANIPEFETWHQVNIQEPWRADPIMNWDKDSRNQIEKEGDLELHSELSVSLIYSYIEEQDIVLACDGPQFLGSNVKRLMRFAEKYLPSGVSDASVLKIERRWVANSLPQYELLHALIYIYSRIRTVCLSLASYLGYELSKSIKEPSNFDIVHSKNKETQYIKFSNRASSSLKSKHVNFDPKFVIDPGIASVIEEQKSATQSANFPEKMQLHSKMAEATFNKFGSHVPMLFLFDEKGQIVDFRGMVPDDQATKFIFWRTISDRISYLRATSLIWISEAWIRSRPNDLQTPIRKLPIIGEILQVIGLELSGKVETIIWDIIRDKNVERPKLALRDKEVDKQEKEKIPNFLIPAYKAFERQFPKK